MRSKIFSLAFVLVLILGLGLAACKPQPVVTPDEPAPPAGESPVAPADDTPVLSEKRGGVLRHALPAIVTLDPAFLSTVQDDQIARYWTDFLVWINSDYEVDWDRSVATGVEISEDGLTYTFSIREGITFHDGRPMTSADIKYTFDRLRDPDVGSAVVGLYSNIVSIETPDDYTVVFTLANTNPDFILYDLNDYHAHIMDINTTDFQTQWNGTGPFMIESYLPEDRLVMVRNPNWWRMGEDGESLPYLDGLEFIFLSDATAQYEALRSGQVDWINYLAPEFVDPINGNSDLRLFGKATNFHYVIRMRSDEGHPAADPLVRKALMLATDRQAILDLAALGQGVVGNDTPIGPAFGAFHLDVIPQRDVAAAKALLAEAGYPDGLTIELAAQDAQIVLNIATVWAEQLAEAGVTVNIQVTPIGVYYGAENVWMEADFAITDWGPRQSPQPYLDLAYVCDAPWGESHFCDPALDELAAKTATELDVVKRGEYFRAISAIFQDRGPIIVPYFGQVALGYRNSVMPGLEWESISTAVDLSEVWLSK